MNPVDAATIEQKVKVTPEPEQIVDELLKKFVSREDWLNSAGVLKEEEKLVDGFGWLLLSEINGTARAEIVGIQSEGLLAEKRKINALEYQRAVILAGVVDPSSPKGARSPLFRQTDMNRVMQIGGSKISEIVDVIERLSAMGQYAGEAEGNSASTPNGGTTSS